MHDPWILGACIILAAAELVFDIFLPPGVAGAVPYVAVILVSLLATGRSLTLAMVAACSVLTVVGAIFSPDGSAFWVDIANRGLALFAIGATGVIGLSLKKKAEQRIKNSEKLAKLVVEAAPLGILTVNEKGRITMVNKVMLELFGYEEEELLGMTIDALVPQEHRGEHHHHQDGYFKNSRTRMMGEGRDLDALHKDGSLFPVEIGLSSFETPDGRVVLAAITDITRRRKAADANLWKYSEELKKSNKELDDFAYIASHDLKEPLRGINNYAVFLKEDYGDKLDDEGRGKLDTMMRLCQRLDGFIDSLLTYSRLGRVEMALRTQDLDEVLDEVVDTLRLALEEKGVEVRRPRRLPCIICDSARVAEIFSNLVTNAYKYNDKEEKWIEIGWSGPGEGESGASLLEGGQDKFSKESIVFYVRDNGIGIPEKHLDNVFAIFKRLHSREKYGGGSGAGLTIAKKIVERHGGRIWVESTVGEGSTFYFTLEKGGS